MALAPPERPDGATPTVSRRARRMREAPSRTGDAKEAALLEVARDLVQRGEFQTTPIGRIAQRAGISRQGFYFYYQSKDELLAQLVTETLYASQSWRDTLYDERGEDAAEVMRGVSAGGLVMWSRNREVLRAAIELAPHSTVWAQWRAIVEETADFLVELIVSSTSIDALRDPDEARRTMIMLIWMIERNCYVHVVHGSDEDDDALAKRIGDAIVRVLGLESPALP